MTVLAGKKAHSAALCSINVPVVECGTRMQLIDAFAYNFSFCERIPVRLVVVMKGQRRTVYCLLFAFNSHAKVDHIGIGGRLSFTGIEALTDYTDPLDFDAKLNVNSSGELTGDGRLWYYPSVTSISADPL